MAQSPDGNGVFFVKKGGTGNQRGDSWSNAIAELSTALKAAKTINASAAGAIKEIWVSGGTYNPQYVINFSANTLISIDNRDNSFLMVKDVKVYGGFAGTETSVAARDLSVTANASILSGDLKTQGDYSDNAYHVVSASGAVGTALLDGFTITGGNANGSTAAVIVNSNSFTRNNGAGIFLVKAAPSFTNIQVIGNIGANYGLGVCIVENATAVVSFTNAVISGNGGGELGGGVGASHSDVNFTNVTICGNSSTKGAGTYAYNGCKLTYNNSIMYGNSGGLVGDAGQYGTYTLSAQYSLLQGIAANVANHILDPATDPLFFNAPSFTTVPFSNGNYAIRSNSPLINAGSNSLFAGLGANTKDLAGNSRVKDYSSGGIIDIGANEYQVAPGSNGVIYVKKGSNGNGSSWNFAAAEVADALKAAAVLNAQTAGKVKQIWVAAGTYLPLYAFNDLNSAVATDRNNGFVVVKDVKMYGGFAGTETDITARNIAANRSILSGDIGVAGTATDNAYHVLMTIGDAGSASVNGFTVSGGRADGSLYPVANSLPVYQGYGGGAFVTNTNCEFTNVIFNDNYSRGTAGGAYVYNGTDAQSVTFSQCTFSNNKSNNSSAGAIYFYGSQATWLLDSVTVVGNSCSSSGGGINSSNGTLTINRSVIKDNVAGVGGGGLYAGISTVIITNSIVSGNNAAFSGGGINFSSVSSGSGVKNVVITGNKAGNMGGGVYNSGSATLFTNVTFAGNSGAGLYNYATNTILLPTVQNSIVYGNSAGIENNNASYKTVISYSLVQGEAVNSSLHIINETTDPEFVNAPDFSTAPFSTGNYSLSNASAVIDSGSNNLFVGLDASSFDAAGNARVTNYSNNGIIDMGAYEAAAGTQKITSPGYIVRTYGEGSFEPGATNNSGLSLSYSSADNSIAQAYQDAADGNKWKIAIKKAGKVLITISQAGGGTYLPASDTFNVIINKAILTITAKDTVKTYTGTAFTGGNDVTYAGFVYSDDQAVALTGTLTYTGTSQGATNVNSYTIIPGGLTAESYTITYTAGALTINKANLTVTAKDSTKVYNGLAFTGGNGVTYTGLVNNETGAVLGGSVTYSGTSQGAVNVNTYVITPAGLTSGNYDIHYANGSLYISQAVLTVTAKDSAKIYDGLSFTGGNGVTYTGLVNNETAFVLGGTLTYSGTSQGATNVNNYVITPGGLTSGNYNIQYADGSLTINKATLTITAIDSAKVYDGMSFTGGNGVSYSGFVNNENATVLTGSITYSGTAQGAVNVNAYVITPGGLTAGNYAVSYVNGALIINKAEVIITADNKARCFAEINPGFTVSYAGFVHGEDSLVLSALPVAQTIATTQTVAGNYDIIPTGAVADNYNFSYVNGTLTIHALPVSNLTAIQGTILCGTSATLPISASGAYSFAWLHDNTAIAETTATLTVAETGMYAAVATDGFGCKATVANNIAITRLLAPQVAFNYNSYCVDKAVNFTNTSDITFSGVVNYTWSSGNGESSSNISPQFTYSAAGNYTVSLIVTPQNCPTLAVTASQVIPVEAETPGIRLTQLNAQPETTITLQARNLLNASYSWLPATGLSNASIAAPNAVLQKDQDYLVEMSFPSGCVATDSLHVSVYLASDILVPNVFSANGDGQNDILYANLRGMKKLNYFRVFNRWGKKIFESFDMARGWDGTCNGELQPLATYVWVAEGVDNNGNTIRRQGSVTLLR
ncbi:gliding motility-associated C-terminal domain-containing protein [Filimonas lacunae]|uniref:Gliding motility-associated C-terminal domain-containing protein n=3 Tax=Filimonas lacunae TaxID=477680 RepID=A0A1N7R0U3_9BACT|nr:gliding motility-associated C-terminal domain-containing protein [Filimonas lacunae]